MPPPRAALAALRRDLKALRAARLLTAPREATHPQYRDDPLGYIRDVLHVTLSPGQTEAVKKLLQHPRRLLVSSGHSVGKSLLVACLVCWFFDSRAVGTCVTTAPKLQQVVDIVWKEVRGLRARAGLPDCWSGPKAPRLETAPDHVAYGITARDATSFQGQHSPGGLLFIFDEAEGIDHDFFRAVKTMLDDQSYFVAIYNPTGGSGTATHEAERQADEHGLYLRHTLSCLDHPNVIAQARGEVAPIPGAITLEQLRMMLLEDSITLGETDEHQPGDVTLCGVRYRPGPIAGARCLGRRPLLSRSGVWNEELWARVLATRFTPRPEWGVVIGCDVARYGDNQTVIMVRKGYCALHAEVHSKQSTEVTARQLREVCNRFADAANPERRIPCLIDEGGVGSGVIDQADGHLFVPVNASRKPHDAKRYVNVRSELWFTGRAAALAGCLDLHRLNPALLSRLREELMATQYEVIDGTDKIWVSSKDEAVERLKRSPDVADALNLSLYSPALQPRRGEK